MCGAKVVLVLALLAIDEVLSMTNQEKKELLEMHNKLRTSVPAANMMEMSWDESAAQMAQNWANQCKRMQHDNATKRAVAPFGNCGQNIYVTSSALLPTWANAFAKWKSGERRFNFNSTFNIFSEVSSYTQLIWASSHKVGCGVALCKDSQGQFLNFVCNYCPAGNVMGRIGLPFKLGAKCSGCMKTCSPLTRLCIPKISYTYC